jgi:glutathione S-transferase
MSNGTCVRIERSRAWPVTVRGVRVYYRPGSGRPVRVAWLLEELALPYEAVAVSREEPVHRHPLGRVPVLETDGGDLFESAAICLALGDGHPDVMPPLGTRERALVYQWTLFAMTEIEPSYLEWARNLERDPARAGAGADAFRARGAVLDDVLAGRDFLVAGRLTVADVVTGGVLGLALRRKLLPDPGLPNLSGYVERLTKRPAFVRAAAATESSLLELTR